MHGRLYEDPSGLVSFFVLGLLAYKINFQANLYCSYLMVLNTSAAISYHGAFHFRRVGQFWRFKVGSLLVAGIKAGLLLIGRLQLVVGHIYDVLTDVPLETSEDGTLRN